MKKDREHFDTALSGLRTQSAAAAANIETLSRRIEQVGVAVKEIQPVHIDLTQELADEIVLKMHGPLTIPQQMSDWIREQAQYRDVLAIHGLGYGPNPGTMQVILQAKGTLFLQFKDTFGTIMWEGTFMPPRADNNYSVKLESE